MTACTWDLQRDNSSVADILHISWDKYIWTFWQWNNLDSDIQLMKNKQLSYPLEYYLFLLFPTVTVSLKLVFLYSNLFSFSYRKTFIFTYELMIYIKKYFSAQLNWNFFPSSLYLNQTILFTYKLKHTTCTTKWRHHCVHSLHSVMFPIGFIEIERVNCLSARAVIWEYRYQLAFKQFTIS